MTRLPTAAVRTIAEFMGWPMWRVARAILLSSGVKHVKRYSRQ